MGIGAKIQNVVEISKSNSNIVNYEITNLNGQVVKKSTTLNYGDVLVQFAVTNYPTNSVSKTSDKLSLFYDSYIDAVSMFGVKEMAMEIVAIDGNYKDLTITPFNASNVRNLDTESIEFIFTPGKVINGVFKIKYVAYSLAGSAAIIKEGLENWHIIIIVIGALIFLIIVIGIIKYSCDNSNSGDNVRDVELKSGPTTDRQAESGRVPTETNRQNTETARINTDSNKKKEDAE